MREQNTGSYKWTDKDLSWYRYEVDFNRVLWWEKNEGYSAQEEETGIIENHSLLWSVKEKGKPQLATGPVLWEILRRHPDIPVLRARIRSYEKKNGKGSYERDLNPWHERGPDFFRLLLTYGNDSWPVISASIRELIKIGMKAFLKSELNMPTGKRIGGPYLIDYPALQVWPNYSATLMSIFEDQEDFDLDGLLLGEIKKKIEMRGEKLVVMSIDPDMTRTDFKELVYDEAERQVFGESVRDVSWKKSHERVKEKAEKIDLGGERRRLTIEEIEEVKASVAKEEEVRETTEKKASRSKRKTFNITQEKLRHLSKLDLGYEVTPDIRKNVNAMFADFSLL